MNPPNSTGDDASEEQQQQKNHAPTGLRILCLHDANSSAARLKQSLTLLGDRLYEKHGIDLVYINSPLCSSTHSGESDRVWWETRRTANFFNDTATAATSALSDDEDFFSGGSDDEDQKTAPRVHATTQQPAQQQQSETEGTIPESQQSAQNHDHEQLIGLDAALLLLQQVWSTSMPFWGILGIGQGAAVGSLLSLLPDVKPKPKFGIFIQGEPLIQDAEPLLENNDDWSCLHIFDPATSSDCERLVQQFGGDVHHARRPRDGLCNKKDLNVIGKFIVDQKKLLRDDPGSMALVIRNQLHLVEQEASRLIAQRIAENPPGPLMAVIAPKGMMVGGHKRRGPGEEGGGAPCPPEFLLKRETRYKGDDGGASSRQHPQTKQQQPPPPW